MGLLLRNQLTNSNYHLSSFIHNYPPNDLFLFGWGYLNRYFRPWHSTGWWLQLDHHKYVGVSENRVPQKSAMFIIFANEHLQLQGVKVTVKYCEPPVQGAPFETLKKQPLIYYCRELDYRGYLWLSELTPGPTVGKEMLYWDGAFQRHRSTPCIIQVMDDHDSVLKQPWFYCGIHDLRTPQMAIMTIIINPYPYRSKKRKITISPVHHKLYLQKKCSI